MTRKLEDSAETAIRKYVLTKAALGIYDPNQPRRPQVPVVSFDIELLEIDEEDRIIHAAGPVVLRSAEGDVERYLRVSSPFQITGGEFLIPNGGDFRAAYIEETNQETGACKETIALANAPALETQPLA